MHFPQNNHTHYPVISMKSWSQWFFLSKLQGSSDSDESVLLRQALSSHDNSASTSSNNNLNRDEPDQVSTCPAPVPKLSGSDNSTSSGMGGVNPNFLCLLRPFRTAVPPGFFFQTTFFYMVCHLNGAAGCQLHLKKKSVPISKAKESGIYSKQPAFANQPLIRNQATDSNVMVPYLAYSYFHANYSNDPKFWIWKSLLGWWCVCYISLSNTCCENLHYL